MELSDSWSVARVLDLDFADDVTLLEVSWFFMVATAMRMQQVTQIFGINISARKSKRLLY